MSTGLRALPCPAGPAVLEVWWEPLASALVGTGPALLPVPAGPAAGDVLAAGRPDRPVEAGTALVVPTSGSTGRPRAAVLPATALRHSATATLDRLGGPGRWLLALPVTHIAGLQVLVRSVLAGLPPEVLDPGPFTAAGFAAAAARLGDGPGYTALVPTQLARVLDEAPAVLAGFAGVLVGGAATPPALLERAAAAGARLLTTYGMTETAGGCVYDGLPLAGVRVALDPDGRIRLGGPTVFTGYRLRPELTAAGLAEVDGVRWHRTNDAGSVDADGRLAVLGRLDDVVVTGGRKVAPDRVEAALVAHPAVRAAGVVGRADERWGQRVVAVVVAADPAAPPTLDRLRAELPGLERHALPRELVLVDDLPLLASGKLDRAGLRARLADGRMG